ncbi:MAG: hypothetical protein WC533_03980 [Candidatus Pacearchaeota archaeon]
MNLKLTIIMFAMLLIISSVSSLTINNVVSVPSEISPGNNANIELEIGNEAGETIKNVVVSLDFTNLPFAPYKSSTDRVIEKIKDGDEETIDFNIIALSDADAGTYKVPVKIFYILNNKTMADTSFIGLTINDKPKLQVDYGGILIKGANNEITIRLTNSGLTKVKFLRIQLIEVANIKILGNSEVYIGDVESDDFDSANFNIFISKDSADEINLPVALTYRDATNRIEGENIDLNLKIYTRKEAIELGLIKQNNTGYYILGVIALFIIWMLYRSIRKRRRKKKTKED